MRGRNSETETPRAEGGRDSETETLRERVGGRHSTKTKTPRDTERANQERDGTDGRWIH